MKLWQLKNLQTGEFLTEPGPLPEFWGPIFGLHGFKDKLHDLSWVGSPHLGWIEIDISDNEIEKLKQKKLLDAQIQDFLNQSLEYVAADNLNVTKKQRSEWIEYRQKLKEMNLQPGYPLDVYWPKIPD